MKIVLTCCFILCSMFPISAQEFENNTIDFQNLGIEKPKFGWESTKFDFQPKLNFSELNNQVNPLEEGLELNSNTIDLYPGKISSYTFPSNPFTTNYDFFGNAQNDYRIDKNSWMNFSNYHAGYWGLGVTNTVSGTYYRQLSDNWVLSAGLSAGKYSLYGNFGNNASINGNLTYLLSDRIKLNFSGRYSIGNVESGATSSTYQQAAFGSDVEIKVGESWGLVVGVEYVYDAVQQKWVAVPYIRPVVYKSLADMLSLNKKKHQKALLQNNVLEAYKLE